MSQKESSKLTRYNYFYLKIWYLAKGAYTNFVIQASNFLY